MDKSRTSRECNVSVRDNKTITFPGKNPSRETKL